MGEWKTPVQQARYSDDGHWYALLNKFPAALVDANGYLLFESEEDFRLSPHITIGKQVSVRKPTLGSSCCAMGPGVAPLRLLNKLEASWLLPSTTLQQKYLTFQPKIVPEFLCC